MLKFYIIKSRDENGIAYLAAIDKQDKTYRINQGIKFMEAWFESEFLGGGNLYECLAFCNRHARLATGEGVEDDLNLLETTKLQFELKDNALEANMHSRFYRIMRSDTIHGAMCGDEKGDIAFLDSGSLEECLESCNLHVTHKTDELNLHKS